MKRPNGAIDILRYNWHFYAASVAALLAMAAAALLHLAPLAIVALCAAPVAFWSIASVAASYYVYDHAEVTLWNWLPAALAFHPKRWLNVHAGLDQSTETLRLLFPNADGAVCDIYDAAEMTEPSIARARRETGAIRGSPDQLPFATGDRDCIFLLFSAHEIRSAARRAAFFREAARVLAPGGSVFLVEHLRDVPNFIAFGPGFLHFHSRATWLRAAASTDLELGREGSLTPFVHWLLFRKAVP